MNTTNRKKRLKTQVEGLEPRAMLAGDSAGGFIGVGAFGVGLPDQTSNSHLAGEVASALSGAGASALGAIHGDGANFTKAINRTPLAIEVNYQSALATDAAFELDGGFSVISDATPAADWAIEGLLPVGKQGRDGALDALLDVFRELTGELGK